mmetsp:Transcript_5981/g.11133  ORF Transcript_5981/g.11133 Transcript_5981/m.11133 type:complete len:219 (+) Transcript_5981:1734-2390(+)
MASSSASISASHSSASSSSSHARFCVRSLSRAAAPSARAFCARPTRSPTRASPRMPAGPASRHAPRADSCAAFTALLGSCLTASMRLGTMWCTSCCTIPAGTAPPATHFTRAGMHSAAFSRTSSTYANFSSGTSTGTSCSTNGSSTAPPASSTWASTAHASVFSSSAEVLMLIRFSPRPLRARVRLCTPSSASWPSSSVMVMSVCSETCAMSGGITAW